MENFSADARWMTPFAPKYSEPACYGTTQLKLRPRELVSTSSKATDFTFDIPSIGQDYINLQSIQLLVKGKVLDESDTVIGGDEGIAVCNNFLHSLFEKIDIICGVNH